jgi:glyoxylase-like metal-dependent hydrolase (beta-lactamase superfamily II)
LVIVQERIKYSPEVIHYANIGRFEIASLQVWPVQQIPIQDVVVHTDPRILEQARARQPHFFGDDATLAEFTQNICVVRSAEQTVLVDTGQPLRQAGAILQWGLASMGIEPHQIDLVFLSHRDDNHVGGTVDLRGDPLYPKARYLMSRFEYQDYKLDTKRFQGFQAWIKPLENRGLLELFDEGAEIASGLVTVPTPGHRSGATSLRVQDGAEAALLLADTLHLPVQVTYPQWSSVWDSDSEVAARTRQRIIEQAELEGLLLAVPHTPFGGLGYVRREDGQRVWSPIA